jgi:hypothetical protein
MILGGEGRGRVDDYDASEGEAVGHVGGMRDDPNNIVH